MRFSPDEQARFRGWRDYWAGYSYGSCPYLGTLAVAWKAGWIEAEKEDQDDATT